MNCKRNEKKKPLKVHLKNKKVIKNSNSIKLHHRKYILKYRPIRVTANERRNNLCLFTQQQKKGTTT